MPATHTLPAQEKVVKLNITEVSEDATWLFKLAGPRGAAGKYGAAQTEERKGGGTIAFSLNEEILLRPGQGWQVKLGLTGPAGSYAVFDGVEFVTD